MTESAAEGARRENFGAKDFLAAEAELNDLLNKVESAKGRYKAARKRWKSDGLNLAMYDAVQTLKKQDEADVADNERDRLKYAKWANLDLGFQSTFEFTPLTPKEQEQRDMNDATQLGYLAGRRGDERKSNPFQAGTVAYAAFDTGWINGEKEHFDDAKKEPRQPAKGAGPEVSGGAKKRKAAKEQNPEPVGGNAEPGAAAGAEPLREGGSLVEATEASQGEGVRTSEQAGSAQPEDDAAAGGSPAPEAEIPISGAPVQDEDPLEIPAFLKRS